MNIQAMMKQAQKMQQKMEEEQKKINQKEFKVTKQGIEVVLMGDKKIKSININDALIDPDDKEIMEGLIILAINEAQTLIDQAVSKNTPNMSNGMPF